MKLRVRGYGFSAWGLDFRLEYELGQLVTLQCLRQLDFSGTVQNISAVDVAWIRTNMRNLTTVQGKCNEYGTFAEQPEQAEWASQPGWSQKTQ